jgi:DNA-binding NarL/FixJ family response regulator
MFRTLIVEDSLDFRSSLSELLCERFPCMSVGEAGNGAEAMDKLSHGLPQLIFMDIKLPDTSGLELTRAIKTRHDGVVIVVITAYDIPEYREAAMESGASYFVPKSTATGAEIAALVDSAFPAVCG